MRCKIFTQNAQWQQLTHEWYRQAVEPPYEFSFTKTEGGLLFLARRHTPALIHPMSIPGNFQEELWRYDAAEFFITSPNGERYLEFNLSPNGAWWACVFQDPREVAPAFASWRPKVKTEAQFTAESWQAQALISAESLQEAGIDLNNCHLAACAILNSPEQVFLTSARPCDTQPDFHRPDLWEKADVCC